MARKIQQRRVNGEGSVYYREDKGLWCASVQVGTDRQGKRKRKVIYAKTEKELIAKKKELESSVITGTYIEPSKTTVEEFISTWLKDICKPSLRQSTYLLYEGIINKHIIPSIGKVILNKLAPIHIQSLYNSKLSDGLSASRVKHLHAILHKAFSQAVKWGMVNQNPTDLVEKPRVRKREIQVWNQKQVNQFLKTAEGEPFYCLFLLALTTGMRQGELLGLQWDDIDLKKGLVSVRRSVAELEGRIVIGEPKTNSSRRLIALPKVVVSAIKEHRKKQLQQGFEDCKWIFTDSKGGVVRALNMVDRSFKPLIEKAKVPVIRFHDLRHTHATLLLQQGVNPKLVQERLGHATISLTLDTYSHVLPNMQRQVVKELNTLFG